MAEYCENGGAGVLLNLKITITMITMIIIIINDHNNNWDTMILMTPTDWCLMTLWMPRIATLSLAVKLNSLQMMADDSAPQKQIQICLNADHLQ